METRTIENGCLRVVVAGNCINSLEFKGKNFFFPRGIITYEDGAKKMRGGSHPCFPIFGSTPPGFPEIPPHGWLRDTDPIMIKGKNDPYIIETYTNIGGTRNYPWLIGCITQFKICNNILLIQYTFKKVDTQESMAPFNLALHHYWVNPKGIKHNFNLDLPERPNNIFRGILEKAIKIRIDTPTPRIIPTVNFEIIGIGKVKMEMISDGENYIVVWSDNPDFLCIEQVINTPFNFGKTAGLHLHPGIFLAQFRLEFKEE